MTDFKTYRVTNQIHLGAFTLDLPKNAEVQFDTESGVMKYGGKEYSVPSLNAAIDRTWLVLSSDKKATYKLQASEMSVKPAKSTGLDRGTATKMGSVVEDDREVSTVKASEQKRKDALANPENWKMSKNPTPEVPDSMKASKDPDGHKNRPAPRPVTGAAFPPLPKANAQVPAKAPKLAAAKNGKTDVGSDVGGAEEGTVVAAKFKTSAVSHINLTNGEVTPGKANNTKSVQDSQEGIVISKPFGGKPVAKQASQQTELEDEPEPEAVATGDVQEAIAGDDLEQLLPDAASSGVPPFSISSSQDTPLFDWDTKTVHWRERVKLAVEKYGSDQAAIAYICKQETPSVVKQIHSLLEQK